MKNIKNTFLFILYTAILGAIVGIIIWSFLKIMNISIEFLWDYLPKASGFPFYTITVCVAGGFLIGLWKRKFGNYPEELNEVLKGVKKTGRYSYKNLFPTIGSALFPLIIGSSVGPEAGLTGIIAGLCTWVGDKLKHFSNELKELTKIGISATLGTIFHSPMFGFMEPLEEDKNTVLPKKSKIVLYFTAILSSFGIFILLNRIFGGGLGLEIVGKTKLEPVELLYSIPLCLVGILFGYIYLLARKLAKTIAKPLENKMILSCTIGGILLGISGTFLPLTMFSGEEQIAEVMKNAETIGAVMLLIVAVVKLFLTNLCIQTGLKGGHFFPVIFCGICVGASISLLTGIDAVFCTAAVTASLVAHMMKKPLATVLLLMIIFPINLIPVILFSAFAANIFKTPKALQ